MDGESSFEQFLEWSIDALNRIYANEKEKRIILVNGHRLNSKSVLGRARYLFERNADDYLPLDISLECGVDERTFSGRIVWCTELEVEIELSEDLGKSVPRLEVKTDARQLVLALIDRMNEFADEPSEIVRKLALGTRSDFCSITTRPEERDALETVLSQDLTFVWGPPGTGKTEVLARITKQLLEQDKRILMISGANVAVDEATLRVADMSGANRNGVIVRYGNPRDLRLEDRNLTSRSLARNANPTLAIREYDLVRERKLADGDRRNAIDEELKKIRSELSKAESDIVRRAQFVATTLAKTTIDKAVYETPFDVVLYDEVGMALVPQVVFAGSLAGERMCCFGDFRQLAPIVDDGVAPEFVEDIFTRLGIVEAVDQGESHDLLVMLTEQHRCHPEIASFVGEVMYSGLLTTAEDTAANDELLASQRPCPGSALALLDLSGIPSMAILDQSSHINFLSACFSVGLALAMKSQWGSIALISPYRSQAALMRSMVEDILPDGESRTVRCATVHGFQGSQAEAVIFDIVDCAPRKRLGVLLTKQFNNAANRLLNVAMTRARGKFITVANLQGMAGFPLDEGLLLTELLDKIDDPSMKLRGKKVFDSICGEEWSPKFEFFAESSDTWEQLTEEIARAESSITLVLPGDLVGEPHRIQVLSDELGKARRRGVVTKLFGKGAHELLPDNLRHIDSTQLPNTALALFDQRVLWCGLPCSRLARYRGRTLSFDPAFRVESPHACRMIVEIINRKVKNAGKAAKKSKKSNRGVQLAFDI